MTLTELKAASPFPWSQQINFDGKGGVRLLDAKGIEVPLFSVMAISIYASKIFNQSETPAQQPVQEPQ
jgi:hypothetical protein